MPVPSTTSSGAGSSAPKEMRWQQGSAGRRRTLHGRDLGPHVRSTASIRRRNFVGGKKKIRQRHGKGIERSRKRERIPVYLISN
ncbi:hypothetical protein BRADI_5g15055v3 [Brachypodium distachyon]|uniref:Uncharacterized protein n=1 Tax=Brachypodium distachyon TaxID=15368 RepID=A0A0Q3EAN4_BRADI|nr:hypothetical protein BRADI_5g15055v3 [Brachypodium distachyon]